MVPQRPLRQKPGIVVRKLREETLILDVHTERYLKLDAVGTRVWDLLSATADIDSVVAAIAAEYDVAPSIVESDVSAFIAELLTLELAEHAA